MSVNDISPITFAVSLGHLELVKLLVKLLQDNGGEPLKKAVRSSLSYIKFGTVNDYNIAKHLLLNGADPNELRLLENVIMHSHSELINLLLVHGAIYMCNYEYIDKVTKQPVCKKVRYNDPDFEKPGVGLSLIPSQPV